MNNNNPIAFADPFGLEGGPGKGTKAKEGTGYSANRGGVWTGEDVTLDEIEITAKAEGSFWKGVGGFLKSIVTQYSDNAKIVFNFKTLGYAIKGGLSYGIARSYVESELEKEVELYQESGGFVGYAVQKVLSSPGLAENLLALDLGKNLYQGNQEQAGYESAMLGWIVVDALLTKRGGGPKRPKMKVKFPTYFGGKWGSVAKAKLSSSATFNRGSRIFKLEQGNASSGWKHIYDRHIDRFRFTKKTKFDSNLSESDIKGLLNKTLKHGKESSYDGLPVFEYRTKINGTYRKYRATVNTDGTVRTFHPLE